MTIAQTAAANPFALLMNPEAVFAALAGSDRLARLHSRVCRPLDKPLIARAENEAMAFDDSVDAAPEPIETIETTDPQA